MAVSLKKDNSTLNIPMREITPVHIMDEEEAVRVFCPRREEHTDGKTEIQEINKDNPPKATGKSDRNLVNAHKAENVEVLAYIIATIISSILTILVYTWVVDFITGFSLNV